MSIETSIASLIENESGQPYPYTRVELVEPDWTRFPGWKDVTAEELRVGSFYPADDESEAFLRNLAAQTSPS